MQDVQIFGEHFINNTSLFVGKPDAANCVESGVGSLSGRSQIHQGQAASITGKVGPN